MKPPQSEEDYGNHEDEGGDDGGECDDPLPGGLLLGPDLEVVPPVGVELHPDAPRALVTLDRGDELDLEETSLLQDFLLDFQSLQV